MYTSRMIYVRTRENICPNRNDEHNRPLSVANAPRKRVFLSTQIESLCFSRLLSHTRLSSSYCNTVQVARRRFFQSVRDKIFTRKKKHEQTNSRRGPADQTSVCARCVYHITYMCAYRVGFFTVCQALGKYG